MLPASLFLNGTVTLLLKNGKSAYPSIRRLDVDSYFLPVSYNRLYGAILAGPLLIVSMFWLSWTGNFSNIHWVRPSPV